MLTVQYGILYPGKLTVPLPQRIGTNDNSSYGFYANWKHNKHTGFLTVTQTRIVESLLSGRISLVSSVTPFAESVDIDFRSSDESRELAKACIEVIAHILDVPAELWQFKDRTALRETLSAIDALDKEDRDVIRQYMTSGISS